MRNSTANFRDNKRSVERAECWIDLIKEKNATGEEKIKAFTGVVHTAKNMTFYQVGCAQFNVGGYTETFIYFDSYREAADCADWMNKELGLSVKETWRIVASSMNRPAVNN